MFRKTISTIVGGGIGLFALYAVAKLSYRAGHEMAEAEHRYAALQEKPRGEVSEKLIRKPVKKSWLAAGVRNWLGIDDPEVHVRIRNGSARNTPPIVEP